LIYQTNVDKWYCCLNPAEFAAVQVCAANSGPITYFVVKALVDACFLLAFEGNGTTRENLFIMNWGITVETVPPGDPEGIEMCFMSPAIWDEINLYLDEHGTGCSDECKVKTFPN